MILTTYIIPRNSTFSLGLSKIFWQLQIGLPTVVNSGLNGRGCEYVFEEKSEKMLPAEGVPPSGCHRRPSPIDGVKHRLRGQWDVHQIFQDAPNALHRLPLPCPSFSGLRCTPASETRSTDGTTDG